jgi:hypothetical protein
MYVEESVDIRNFILLQSAKFICVVVNKNARTFCRKGVALAPESKSSGEAGSSPRSALLGQPFKSFRP